MTLAIKGKCGCITMCLFTTLLTFNVDECRDENGRIGLDEGVRNTVGER
jgi:hypothetical protein